MYYDKPNVTKPSSRCCLQPFHHQHQSATSMLQVWSISQSLRIFPYIVWYNQAYEHFESYKMTFACIYNLHHSEWLVEKINDMHCNWIKLFKNLKLLTVVPINPIFLSAHRADTAVTIMTVKCQNVVYAA